MKPQKQDNPSPRSVSPERVQQAPDVRKAEPPRQPRAEQPKSTPPAALQNPPGGPPGKAGAAKKSDDDDDKKKKHP